MARVILNLIVVGACVLLGAGCEQLEIPAMRIPLKMGDLPKGEQSVAISMVYTTGWVHLFAILHPENVKKDHIEIHRIEFIDAKFPTLFVPKISSCTIPGSILTFMKSDNLGLVIFAPGLDPMFYGNVNGTSSGLRVADDEKHQPVIAMAKPYITTVASLSEFRSETKPSTWPAYVDAWHNLLDLTELWDQLRWKYFWGESRQEIRVICRTIANSAHAYEISHPQHQWTAQQKQNIDWCRSVVNP